MQPDGVSSGSAFAARLKQPVLMAAAFVAAASGFFLLIGLSPLRTLADMVRFAAGDSTSLSETLVKTAPILLCALATLLPARLGLVSVGADGQLYVGGLVGTGVVLALADRPAALLLPAMLLGGITGGAAWGCVAGLLRGRLEVNETITTLLLNYVGALLVNALVFGPWKDPGNLGWPATVTFPDAATLAGWFGTRVHAGLGFGIAAAIGLAVLLDHSRWGTELTVLKGNAKVGRMIGLSFSRSAILVMSLGGALAGLAGICEVSAVQGRLQPGLSLDYGLTGFLVAWLAGHRPLATVPISLFVGGLLAAGDALQLYAKVPAASATILQGLLFATALAVGGLANRAGRAHG